MVSCVDTHRTWALLALLGIGASGCKGTELQLFGPFPDAGPQDVQVGDAGTDAAMPAEPCTRSRFSGTFSCPSPIVSIPDVEGTIELPLEPREGAGLLEVFPTGRAVGFFPETARFPAYEVFSVPIFAGVLDCADSSFEASGQDRDAVPIPAFFGMQPEELTAISVSLRGMQNADASITGTFDATGFLGCQGTFELVPLP